MSKFTFNRGNEGMEKVCSGSNGMTKEQKAKDFKQSLFHTSKRLKAHKQEMEALAFLEGGYNYNGEHLNAMIGQCFIEIHQVKEQKKELKKMVKQLKLNKEK